MLARYRLTVAVVIVGLLLSGITAFPLLTELNVLASLLTPDPTDLNPEHYEGLTHWILTVRQGLENTYRDFPFIAYGTDWLAFGHIVIALFFILPYREPVRYRGVLHVGVAACLLVLPLALLCGPLRGIPLAWRLIDCSFGLLCLLPLLYALRLSRAFGDYQPSPSAPDNR